MNHNPDQIPISPLLNQAKCFLQQLEVENRKIEQFLENGGDQKEISIETVNENEQNVIEMNLYMGLLESNAPNVVPLEELPEFPDDQWQNAGIEPQGEDQNQTTNTT